MTIEKVLYQTSVTTTGGREGHSSSEDGALDLNLATPKELGGKGGNGTNPEQLFAAGYSACFLSAMQLTASRAKVALPAQTKVTGKVGIGSIGEGFGIEVELVVDIPGVEHSIAQNIIDKAHEICPYSNATRGNIDVTLTVAE
ncbi:organic hydroperoxide resistance protein [Celerinatantimonas diazotrophica]|uniref:Ohr subfamily peroxiredoxin n=1 Tax=Celerinatantimonas diazotrophica TaxID=412034 RepID=A0A4R1KDL5_9GAMM|nr:organic hydroperoxide resistance protein [Celerinatantimonas diazotrophica]TCK62768.1 Ohr subfamily peroxiredoxin [Celerinatantimonas diazotrophica]CAG9298398.1 Organic hydroperoxide resistance protein OhrB [Celerinatantimonas diazotrophica]